MPSPVSRTLDLELPACTPFLDGGHQGCRPALPKLAPARFSPAEQAADASAPRTRLVKDVLRTGRWKVGHDERGQPVWWEVSRQTLREIARQFQLAQSRGVAQNLVWGHGDPHTKIVDPRNLIAPLDQVFVEGDTLWASAYLPADKARELRNPAHKVSVRVMENWTDGAGRAYPIMLLHVAVVDQPVLDTQGPFVDLGLTSSTPDAEGSSMPLDYQRTLDSVNTLLALGGLEMPDTTTEDNFNDTLDMLVGMLQGDAPPEDEADPEAAGKSPGGTAADPGEEPPAAEMSQQVGRLTRQVRDLCNQVARLQRGRGRRLYLERVQDLATRGHISAREVNHFHALGERFGWDLALLDAAGERQAIDMGRYARRGAQPHAPRTHGVQPNLSPAELKEGVAALGGRAS